MCSHYEGVRQREQFLKRFRTEPPPELGRHDVWPGYEACFIRRHENTDAGDEAVPEREAMLGLFGLVPHWARDLQITRRTYNARSETVAEKPSYRDAWRHAQHCIIPAEAFYEPDWRSGRAVPTRISRADGEPMGIAGLWSRWRTPDQRWLHSYTMLTINADTHALMKNFHKPGEEKRMVVVLPEDRYEDWLHADPVESMVLLQPYPADRLQAGSTMATARQLF